MDSAQREGVRGNISSVGIGRVIGFGAMLAFSCLFSYWIITNILAREFFASRDDDLVGGMWAVIATVFVFRQSLRQSAQAALSRTVATLLAFALCFVYLLIFPFSAFGMAALIWICTVILYFIGRSEDIITAAITIAVVLVVAAVSSGPAWLQPILRLVDTVVGIVVGFLASRLCFVFGHSPAIHLNAN